MIDGKITVYYRAPALTQSGYGYQARELLDYLLSDDKYLVFLDSVNWGNCGYINEKTCKDKTQFRKYVESIARYEQGKDSVSFDLCIHCTIPNEVFRKGQINILWMAGIESDRVSLEWINKCNEMDLVIVPSKHSAETLAQTAYQVRNGNSQEASIVRFTKPLFVIPEYFEKPKNIKPLDLKFDTTKNLLSVGLWGGKGGFGEDRKNIADLIKFFIQANKEDPNAGLILKTQIVNGCSKDREATIQRVKEIKSNFGDDIKCKIHLIHQELTDEEMWGLYSHPQVTGYISLTHGEGFGRPLLEAAACGKPIIATNWSGHLDFLRKEGGFLPVDYEMIPIPECQIWENILIKESKWAKVDEKNALKRIKRFMESPRDIQKKAEANIEWLEQNFGKEAVWKRWSDLFGQFIKEAPEEIVNEVSPEYAQYETVKKSQIDILAKDVDRNSEKEKVLYVMPQSAGDCLISTSIINSLIINRHPEDVCDFYIATSPQFKDIFNKIVSQYGAKVIDYNHDLMMQAELTREVWDAVYMPGINVQFRFSNWLLGNGDYSVRLLEEFAKNCNISPGELRKYKFETSPCDLPNRGYIVIAPGGQKSAKAYKYWDEVIENLKEMVPELDLVQVGAPDEELLKGVHDYRGKTFAESFYVIQNAVMLVGCDSFPAHAAAATETPHLVIYGSTHANTCSPVVFKKELPQLAIESSQCDPKCYKDSCIKSLNGKNCLSYIEPSSICYGIKSILERILEQNKKEEETENESSQ